VADPEQEPQASAFWPLLTGEKKAVIQPVEKRAKDCRAFKYVGVAGIDKPRIAQVAVSADQLHRGRPPDRGVFEGPAP
jgi:hypothetical protein